MNSMADNKETELERVNRTLATLGGVLWLCRHSPLHQRYPVALLLERITYSIDINQYRYFQNSKGVPVGFCNWALLSDDLLEEALTGNHRFETSHWKSGNNIFITEMIAPFGHCRKIARDLRQNIFSKDSRATCVRGHIGHPGEEAPIRIQRFCNV